MKLPDKARLSVGLMVIGLIALAAFEVIWLRSEYHREVQYLQIKQNDFFHSTVRDLEDSLLQVMVIAPLDIEQDSLEFMSSRGSRIVFQRQDTAKTMTIVRDLPHQRRVQTRIAHVKGAHKQPPEEARRSLMLGMLTRQIAEDSLRRDSLSVEGTLMAKLRRNAVGDEYLPFELLSYGENMVPEVQGMMSVPFLDIWSRQHYAVVYPEYRWHAFREILPQLVFCVVLFVCIGLAFLLIYRNFMNQHKLATLRRDFISNITHELKTPIATVRVALEALTDFNAAENRERSEEYMEISRNELDRLTLLVDKVLQLSQFDEHLTQFNFEKVDMSQIVDRTIATMKLQFQQRNAEVEFDQHGTDFLVEGDKLHMTGLVYNLVDNALKYSPDIPEVRISLQQDNGSLILKVEDHGVGIDKDNQQRIFDKFFRVTQGNSHDVKGHGLGLSYVAHVVKAHNGQIDMDSAPGHGTEFTVTIPRQHAN